MANSARAVSIGTDDRSRRRVWRLAAGLVAGFVLSAAAAGVAQTQSADAPRVMKERTVNYRAAGAFDVKLGPLATEDKTEGTLLGRLSIDKQYHGDLEAIARGEMLTAGTAVKNSAGYVAIEGVSGTLHGRKGTFVLQHNGTMTRGEPSLTITVVPDSGTGELAGIEGSMTITIVDRKHSYELNYTLAVKP
jgi:Protein of unknown function (DUF3224)